MKDKKVSRIGIFGGTFDPIHNGHLRLAYAFQKELMLSKVYFIPAGLPYHKKNPPKASGLERLAMVKLAIEEEPLFATDDSEIKQLTPAYTVETLTKIRESMGQNIALWYLMGMDTFAQLRLWKNWETLFSLTNIAVAKRDPEPTLCAILTELWKAKCQEPPLSMVVGKIYALNLVPEKTASTHLRKRLADSHTNKLSIPKKVLQYIAQKKLI